MRIAVISLLKYQQLGIQVKAVHCAILAHFLFETSKLKVWGKQLQQVLPIFLLCHLKQSQVAREIRWVSPHVHRMLQQRLHSKPRTVSPSSMPFFKSEANISRISQTSRLIGQKCITSPWLNQSLAGGIKKS